MVPIASIKTKETKMIARYIRAYLSLCSFRSNLPSSLTKY